MEKMTYRFMKSAHPAALGFTLLVTFLFACKKGNEGNLSPTAPAPKLAVVNQSVGDVTGNNVYYNVRTDSEIRLRFNAPLNTSTLAAAASFTDGKEKPVSFTLGTEAGDSIVFLKPGRLDPLTQYNFRLRTSIRSRSGSALDTVIGIRLITAIDSTDKFPRVSDDELLTLIQRQTFRFFREYAHPVSGMARDRNQNPDIVTTGGTGMGVMAIVAAVHRNFITREEGSTQVIKIVDFLRTKVTSYHGAYPHFINGSSGATIPFSTMDDGADLVETSLLMQGLLTARQFFTGTGEEESQLRLHITDMFNKVEWSWFRKENGNVLYWHWSPRFNWQMNLPVRGWNECLIAYVLASSPGNYSIPKEVYDAGWAGNGAIRNGQSYYNIRLPLGSRSGGPLFFSHYSFLGLDPRNLVDAYADYHEQVKAHTLINRAYSVANPKGYNGYSSSVWGLTASDNNITGYSAHSPDNDLGVISPTAAISSIPFTPNESMEALRFFYYKLGDKIFGEYGFADAFNLSDLWFADSFLAIDQAPQIIMIENYRSGLLWDLFMSSPEVKAGLDKLQFTY